MLVIFLCCSSSSDVLVRFFVNFMFCEDGALLDVMVIYAKLYYDIMFLLPFVFSYYFILFVAHFTKN